MPEADQEKRMAENYEITQAVRIGGKEVVFGIDENCAEPYFCAFYTANELFYEYSDCMVGDNFAEMMKLFGERIRQQEMCIRDRPFSMTTTNYEYHRRLAHR